MARVLNAAYGDGLLSEQTFTHRLDLLLGSPLVDPERLVGDLSFRAPRRRLTSDLRRTLTSVGRALAPDDRVESPAAVLALDWTGVQTELLVGRHHACDVVLEDPSVSRRHAQLRFRDGHWVLRDLESTNGTVVNGVPVVRCQLWPGDRLELGDALLVVD
ncbi:MAG TPA: FHA domain-containing protein [Solirubrobacteraceae bacterium]|nr:FHA domain-containing protein [Solirubrobacteraceae bacterium]